MGVFAQEHDPERVEFWKTVGMLHDIDFELYPEQHCVKANEMLREMDMDEELIHAVVSHAWGMCSDVEPVLYMEKVLFAVDELTGLIGAAALMRPTGFEGMEVKSVAKKFKDKKFAAGCSRDVIRQGAEMLGMELNTLFEKTLAAMQA
jgi:predicted hydrolase (HD superfamily)